MHHLYKWLAVVAAITITVTGCGKFSGKHERSTKAEAEAKQLLVEFNNTDINSYPPATSATTKEEAEKRIKELTQYKKTGSNILKISAARKLDLENSNSISHNMDTADALIQTYKTQIQKLDLEYNK